mgnify:FL=1
MVKFMNKLTKYNNKRNFNITSEPIGKILKKNKKLTFCVQHHIARKDHFDFRLEYNGTMSSWAIPKGPSYNPKDKRLAIKVEDHPISYKNFEGTIPKGEYGAGTVLLFDLGYYEIIKYEKNLIKVILYGKRLKGMWTLTHFKDDNWLLIKDDDFYENYIDITKYKRSIKTNRTMKEIKDNEKKKEILLTNPSKKIIGKITKKDIFNYYKKIAPYMMPYLENRIISVVRAPSGINNNIFFKKHLENQKRYLEKINISSKNDKEKDYYYILDEIGLLSEVQMNSYEFHIWGSNASNKNKPNMMVFDLDPDKSLSLDKLRLGVKYLKEILDNLNLKSFLKTSGGKGYHICIPFKNNLTWKKFYKISEDIANIIENTHSELFTTNNRKEKRKNKIFIDYLRNQKSATFVAPYSVRLRKNTPVSMPIAWNELDKIKPNEITIYKAIKRLKKKDPWKDFFTSN